MYCYYHGLSKSLKLEYYINQPKRHKIKHKNIHFNRESYFTEALPNAKFPVQRRKCFQEKNQLKNWRHVRFLFFSKVWLFAIIRKGKHTERVKEQLFLKRFATVWKLTILYCVFQVRTNTTITYINNYNNCIKVDVWKHWMWTNYNII